MTTGKVGNCYTSNSRMLLRQLDKFLSLLRKILIEKDGEARATSIHQETLVEYERIIPEMPDIGGKGNPLIQNLIQSTSALALYRVLKRQGGTAEETGEFIHRGLEVMLNRYPAFLRRWKGRLQFSKLTIRKMQEAARNSQECKYPGD